MPNFDKGNGIKPSMTDTASTIKPSSSPHDIPTDAPAEAYGLPLQPLVPPVGQESRRRSAAEEARTIIANDRLGTLASLTSDGEPWASIVTYATLPGDGALVICVSKLALHGRNLAADQRASFAVAGPVPDGADPSDYGRVTLAGRFVEPQGAEFDAAREAYHSAISSAKTFSDFGDFTFWLMRPEKVRWVGGFGRMASAKTADYASAEPDPVAASAEYAISHLNEDHADALLDMGRVLAGHSDATSARCLRADRYGLDLGLETPRGHTESRVSFSQPATAADGLRAATIDLTKRARGEI